MTRIVATSEINRLIAFGIKLFNYFCDNFFKLKIYRSDANKNRKKTFFVFVSRELFHEEFSSKTTNSIFIGSLYIDLKRIH